MMDDALPTSRLKARGKSHRLEYLRCRPSKRPGRQAVRPRTATRCDPYGALRPG